MASGQDDTLSRDFEPRIIHQIMEQLGVAVFSPNDPDRTIVRELVLGRRFRYLERSRSLAVYRADLAGPRASNALRQLAQLPWFATNLALKILLTLGLGKVMRRFGRTPPEWPY